MPWIIRRKAELVAAVRGGLLSLEEARERYRLSGEELLFWADPPTKHGPHSLRSTRLQRYRQSQREQPTTN